MNSDKTPERAERDEGSEPGLALADERPERQAMDLAPLDPAISGDDGCAAYDISSDKPRRITDPAELAAISQAQRGASAAEDTHVCATCGRAAKPPFGWCPTATGKRHHVAPRRTIDPATLSAIREELYADLRSAGYAQHEAEAALGEIRKGRPVAPEPAGAPPSLSGSDLDALLSLINDAGMVAYGVETAERLRAWAWYQATPSARMAWGERGVPSVSPCSYGCPLLPSGVCAGEAGIPWPPRKEGR